MHTNGSNKPPRIKAFYGTSPNALKTRVWIARSIRVVVAMVKVETSRGLLRLRCWRRIEKEVQMPGETRSPNVCGAFTRGMHNQSRRNFRPIHEVTEDIGGTWRPPEATPLGRTH